MTSEVQEQPANYNLADLKPVLEKASGDNTLLDSLPIWLSAQTTKSAGRGRSADNTHQYGVQKLRELILELAVRGKLVEQDPNDEPASVLLEKISEEKARLRKEGKIKKQKPLQPLTQKEAFQVPTGWALVRLQQICLLENGDRSKNYPNKSVLVESGIPFVNAGHLRNGKIDRSEMTFITKERFALLRAGKFENGDILFCLRGSLGKSAIVEGFETGAIASSLIILRLYDGLDRYYLHNYFNSPLSESMIRLYDNGTAQPNLSAADLAKFVVPLPPISEQERIVKKVDELMALCDKLERQQADAVQAHDTLVKVLLNSLTQLDNADDFHQNWRRIAEHFDTLFTTESSIDQLKQTLLQLAVMGKLVPQDHNDEPASVLLERIAEEKVRMLKEGKIKKQKPLSEIPKDEIPFEAPTGWSWARFGQIEKNSYTGLDRGKSQQSKDFPTPYFKMNNILNNGGFDLSSLTAVHASEDEINKYRLQNGDFLFNTRNSRELVGKTCVIDGLPENKHTIFNNNILRTTLAPISAHYINIWFRSTSGGELLEQKKSNTTNVCAIYQGKLFELICAVPPLAEQHRIVKKVDELMALYDQLKDRLNQAQTLQQQLADTVIAEAVG